MGRGGEGTYCGEEKAVKKQNGWTKNHIRDKQGNKRASPWVITEPFLLSPLPLTLSSRPKKCNPTESKK